MPTNQMRVVLAYVLDHFTVERRECLYLMSAHGGETYLSWRDGEPLSFVSNLKLMVVKSKEGIWLKWRKWLPFPPNWYHFGPSTLSHIQDDSKPERL